MIQWYLAERGRQAFGQPRRSTQTTRRRVFSDASNAALQDMRPVPPVDSASGEISTAMARMTF